jgi:hypothetical protein
MGLPPLPRSSAPQTEIQVALIPTLRQGIERDYFHGFKSRALTQKTAVVALAILMKKRLLARINVYRNFPAQYRVRPIRR